MAGPYRIKQHKPSGSYNVTNGPAIVSGPHTDKEHARSIAQSYNAKANLLKEVRLTDKQDQLDAIGKATQQAEAKLPRTADSLSKLGAGSEYGTGV